MDAELQTCQDEGLSFHFNEKFRIEHCCEKSLQILGVHEEEREGGSANCNNSGGRPADIAGASKFHHRMDPSVINEIAQRCPSPFLSKKKLHRGEGNKMVNVLIDSGATHNIICN